MIHDLLSRTARSLKGDARYAIDARMTARSLLSMATERGVMALRGSVVRLFFRSSQGIVFIGKRVILRHKHLISCGRSLTIKDGAMIDALSVGGIVFGNNVAIGKSAIIECTGVVRNLGDRLSIGDNSNVGDLNFIAVRGPISIGRNVLLGPRVNMHAENHISSKADVPIKELGESRKGILIEDDCWIGAGAILLDGIRIGKGAIIAAGAVVVDDIPEYTVAGGVPARIIKRRA